MDVQQPAEYVSTYTALWTSQYATKMLFPLLEKDVTCFCRGKLLIGQF